MGQGFQVYTLCVGVAVGTNSGLRREIIHGFNGGSMNSGRLQSIIQF